MLITIRVYKIKIEIFQWYFVISLTYNWYLFSTRVIVQQFERRLQSTCVCCCFCLHIWHANNRAEPGVRLFRVPATFAFLEISKFRSPNPLSSSRRLSSSVSFLETQIEFARVSFRPVFPLCVPHALQRVASARHLCLGKFFRSHERAHARQCASTIFFLSCILSVRVLITSFRKFTIDTQLFIDSWLVSFRIHFSNSISGCTIFVIRFIWNMLDVNYFLVRRLQECPWKGKRERLFLGCIMQLWLKKISICCQLSKIVIRVASRYVLVFLSNWSISM